MSTTYSLSLLSILRFPSDDSFSSGNPLINFILTFLVECTIQKASNGRTYRGRRFFYLVYVFYEFGGLMVGLSDTVTKHNLRARVKTQGKSTRGPCTGRSLSSEIQSRSAIAFELKKYEAAEKKAATHKRVKSVGTNMNFSPLFLLRNSFGS